MVTIMEMKGVTVRDLCRCSLYENERKYTESDFLLMSNEEKSEASYISFLTCKEKLLAD